MKKILLIEDDADFTSMLKELLVPNEIIIADSQARLIAETNSQSFDFVVIDLHLKNRFNGFSAIDYLDTKKIKGTRIIYSGIPLSQISKDYRAKVNYIVNKNQLGKVLKIINSLDLSGLSGEEVFKLMTTTYNHHIRNKLAILQGMIYQGQEEKAQEQIIKLVALLDSMENRSLIIDDYAGKNCKVLDYPGFRNKAKKLPKTGS